jgi:hypothetical protein
MTDQLETWNSLVQRAFGAGARILFPRFFPSKKNQVTLLEMEQDGRKFEAMAKFFVWGNPDVEWEALSRAREAGVLVPGLIRMLDNVIFLEFVPGKTLSSIADDDPDSFDTGALARWLGKFHKALEMEDGLTILKGDVMLPNFIKNESDGEIYGLDFEESTAGRPICEAACLAATVISSGKLYQSPGIGRIREFIKAYHRENPINIDPEELKKLIIESLKSRIRFMPHREECFRKIVADIEKERAENLLT